VSNQEFTLPVKLEKYVAALSRFYNQKGETLLSKILVNGTLQIHEEWEYDNWNGGTYGHAVELTIPDELYLEVIESKQEIQTRLARDLNSLNTSQNEHVSAVLLEMRLSDLSNWREKSGLLSSSSAQVHLSSDVMSRIWGACPVRVFLSHKSSVKDPTFQLKQALERCGIAGFVAHVDIEPTEEWQREIERALFSMEALVALLTEDYHESLWTDQEVGVAIGRGVPHIAIRLGRDPYGLMGKGQGLGGCHWSDTGIMAVRIFHLLYKCLPDKDRIFESAMFSYSMSKSFDDSAWRVENLLSTFENLTSSQVHRLVEVYRENGQNRASFKGNRLLKPLLEKWTGQSWLMIDNQLQPVK
jgi:hypothetical protein